MRLKGMFTVEVSLVLTISFFAVFSSFFMSVLLYDVSVLKAGIDTIVLTASREDKNGTWMEEELAVIESSLLLTELEDVSITDEKTKKIRAKINFPVPLYAALYFKDNEYVVEGEKNEEMAADFVRITEAIKDGI
ncbi:MAG: hypothetical protein J6Z02_01045 [Lachnospiraceae bacterium]|nr:hypothetical protein [Lachnospiraceae bacterium]